MNKKEIIEMENQNIEINSLIDENVLNALNLTELNELKEKLTSSYNNAKSEFDTIIRDIFNGKIELKQVGEKLKAPDEYVEILDIEKEIYETSLKKLDIVNERIRNLEDFNDIHFTNGIGLHNNIHSSNGVGLHENNSNDFDFDR